MTELMSAALGRRIEARNIPFDDWANMVQMPAGPVRDGLKVMYEDYDEYGFPGGNAVVLRAVLEREPRTLESFIDELARDNPK